MATFVHPIGFGSRGWSVLPSAVFQAVVTAAGGSGYFDYLMAGGGVESNLIVKTSACQKYNGVSWSSQSSLNFARGFLGSHCTSSSNFMCSGGSDSNNFWAQNTGGQGGERFNGSSWSYVPIAIYPRLDHGSGGTPTAAILACGQISPNFYGVVCETWNGSSWSGIANSSFSLNTCPGCGTTSNFLLSGGESGSGATSTGTSSFTQIYNGSSWATVANALAAHRSGTMNGPSSTMAVLRHGRYAGSSESLRTQTFNGVTWQNASNGVGQYRSYGHSTSGGAQSFTIASGRTNAGAILSVPEKYE